jgi:hypothetical protein
MNRILLIVTLFIFTIATLQAQTEFRPGYVVKSEGDTLFGQIMYRDYIKMGKECLFKKNKKSKKITFYPTDILAYRFIDGKFFVTKTVNGRPVFLEYLINGKLSMYHYRDSKADHYYFEKDSVPLTELPYEDIYKKDSIGKLNAKKNNKYIGLLRYYLNDAPGIQPIIENIKRLERKNLISLAEYYHNVVCDGEKCIVYEKKFPAFRMNIEASGGVFFDSEKYLDPKYYDIGFSHKGYTVTSKDNAGEVIVRICMPGISENVYFRTGIAYYGLKGIDNNYSCKFESSTIFFPFQFEYVYPIGIVEPRIALGIDYYTSRLITYPSEQMPYTFHFDYFDRYSLNANELILTLGANVRITKHFCWSVNYNMSSINSFTTGLMVKL